MKRTGRRRLRRGWVLTLSAPVRRLVRRGGFGTPSWLTATGAATAIGLTWDGPDTGVSYSVERSLDGLTGWSVIAAPTAPYYADAGLVPGSVYYYRVQATAGAETTPYSPIAFGAALAGSPALILWAEDAYSGTTPSVLTPVGTDGSDVLSLKDRSGNGRHYAAVTAAQKATLRTNVLNGHPIVRADALATNKTFFTTSRFSLSDFYLLAVTKPALNTGATILMGDDNTSTFYEANYQSNGHVACYDGTVGNSVGGTEIASTEFRLNASHRWGCGTTAPGPQWTAWRNAWWTRGNTIFIAGSTVSGGAMGTARLFNRQNGNASEWWGGDLAYLHLWPQDATATCPLAVMQVYQWAAAYYGLTLENLPAPTSLAATATGEGEITLTWDPVTGAHSYSVYRGTGPCAESLAPADRELCFLVKGNTEAGDPVRYVATALIPGQRYWFIVQANADTNKLPGRVTGEVSAVPQASSPTLLSGYNLDFDAGTVAGASGAAVLTLTDGAGIGNATAAGGAAGQATLKVYPSGRRTVIANGTSTQFNVAGARSYGDFHLYLVGNSLDENVNAAALRVLLGDKTAAKFLLRVRNSEAQFYDGTAAPPNVVNIRLRALIEMERSGTQLRVWTQHKQRGLTLTVPSTAITLDALFALNSANYASFELDRLVIYPGTHTLAQRAQNWAYLESQYRFLDGADSYNLVHPTTRLGFQAIGGGLLLRNGDRIAYYMDGETTEGATCRAWWERSRDGGKSFTPVHQVHTIVGPNQYADHVNTFIELPPTHPTHPNRIVGCRFDDTGSRQFTAIWSDSGGDPGSWVEGNKIPLLPGTTRTYLYGPKFLDVDGATLLSPGFTVNAATGFFDNCLMQSTDGGENWTLRAYIAAGTASRQPNETAIVRTSGSNLLAVWRRDVSAGPYEYATSSDNGLTWSAFATFTPAGTEVMISPWFLTLSNGHIWLFIGLRPDGVGVIRSTNGGASWSARRWVCRAARTGNNGYMEAFERPDGLVEMYWHSSLAVLAPPNDKTELWRTVIDPASFWS